MAELLIIGSILFIAYTLAQGKRAQLAGLQPNTLLQNTGGRQTIISGEPNSASPLALTQQTNPTVVVAPPVPSLALPPVYSAPVPSGNLLLAPAMGAADNGSTSFASSVATRTTYEPVAGRYTV